MRGVVDWFQDKKGFGFIIGEDTKSYFVHFKDILSTEKYKTLLDGDNVDFEVEQTPKGFKAIGVKVVSI